MIERPQEPGVRIQLILNGQTQGTLEAGFRFTAITSEERKSRYHSTYMYRKSINCGSLLAILALAPGHVFGDLVDVANRVRSQGCGVLSVADRVLRAQVQLDDAARHVAQGRALDSALSKSGYRARQSAFIHVHSTEGDEGVAQTLARRFCDIVADSNFREIGVYRRGEDTWMVLTAPFAPPGTNDASATNSRVLELINAARVRGRRCGRKTFTAATPLQQHADLDSAALVHAQDMAAHSRLGHGGSDGTMPADRVTRAGYAWSSVAENVAAGQTTVEEVVDTWLQSPGHCTNLMNPRYSETGVAYAVNPASDKGIYWVQVFAAPQ